MDEKTIHELTKLTPTLMQPVFNCAMMLDRIAALQPVGRRALAARLHMSEREVRSLADELKSSGYLKIDAAGMELTEAAQEPLKTAQALVRSLRALSSLETKLTHLLSVGRVIVCAGNCDEDASVLDEMGRAATGRLRQMLAPGATLAVTGGTTIAAAARAIPPGAPIDVQVLPARGGLGRNVETQAGTLAAEIARRLGGHHRLMHLPDTLTPAAQREIVKLPEIHEVLEMLKRTDVLMYGIGRADDMARNRRMSADDIATLKSRGAVAEAFGYYFDAEGLPVMAATSVGLDIEHVENVKSIIAVAGGARKADAILAVTRHHRHDLLVTDEGAARQILHNIQLATQHKSVL